MIADGILVLVFMFFFDKAGDVAYVGKTSPFGDKTRYSGFPARKVVDISRIKSHFNGSGGTKMWKYYYKVKLYGFTDFTSRDIYESWWIDNLLTTLRKSAGALLPFCATKY
ncbi:hypothetical protein ACFVT8_16375 [Lysinibacillus sp. NPDC058147]|uniref:hypothetical protein n=1 Tax=unclassified Lysinibacillus TaxID=2636778 RepID=UPI0036DAD26C